MGEIKAMETNIEDLERRIDQLELGILRAIDDLDDGVDTFYVTEDLAKLVPEIQSDDN